MAALAGGSYFNPDTYTRELVAAGKTLEEANAEAWWFGYDSLRRAIDEKRDFNFETTFGGRSIVRELHRALERGCEVHVFYVGLASPEQNIQRVRERVARGGHAIPEARIRERYGKSLANLVSLIGKATAIHVFDNSTETRDGTPAAKLIFRMRCRRIVEPRDPATLLTQTPEWAKPLVVAAVDAGKRKRG